MEKKHELVDIAIPPTWPDDRSMTEQEIIERLKVARRAALVDVLFLFGTTTLIGAVIILVGKWLFTS